MESLDRSRAVIKLGMRLVTELKISDDSLAQWMAHFIAERIDAVEHASPENRALAQDACASAIFNLWEHRNSLSRDIRPFREIEPLLKTLESLDTDGEARCRYLPTRSEGEEIDSAALSIDYAARVLIKSILQAAGQDAVKKSVPLVEDAASADVDVVLEQHLMAFLSEKKSGALNGVLRSSLVEKIEKLDVLSQMAGTLASELRAELNVLSGDEDG